MILFDENASTLYLFRSAMRWIAVRLDMIAGNVNLDYSFFKNFKDFLEVCAQATTAGLVVALRGVVPAPYAGLALAYANQLSGMTQQVVRLASEAEARFISAQRMCSHLSVCHFFQT